MVLVLPIISMAIAMSGISRSFPILTSFSGIMDCYIKIWTYFFFDCLVDELVCCCVVCEGSQGVFFRRTVWYFLEDGICDFFCNVGEWFIDLVLVRGKKGGAEVIFVRFCLGGGGNY